MLKKLSILAVLFLLASSGIIRSQVRSVFSGDPAKLREELTAFMGPNLNPGQSDNLNTFLSRWDSAAFSNNNMAKIIELSSQLTSRSMRPVPHFNNFIITLNYFIYYNPGDDFFANWLTGLNEIVINPQFTNDIIDKYIKNTGSMIKENVLFESGNVKWKVKNSTLKFLYDTVSYVMISDATLTCYSQRDSTEIYNVTGFYYPETFHFRGTKGIVNWEKAGYSEGDVFAALSNYTIDITKNSFTIDSATITHSTYFKEPVRGTLSDQAVTFRNKERANYPRFVTYTKEFQINDIYEGVNFEGGLTFEGANVKGTGENFSPAKITLFKNDTLYLKIRSVEFLFSRTGLSSQEATVTLYLESDSIYHSNQGFSYVASTRQVNLFQTNNPVSRSPYYNSFHSLDMYFDYLSWNMNDSKIILSRPRGAALGQAQFESSSFFNSNYFMRLMGIDEYHPLNRLIKFSEWYYSETFPVEEFAKWLNKPQEIVTGMCIDLAINGFVFYDRMNNEITIKQKTRDFLDSFSKKKDYDVINILSETKAPLDNAILDMNTDLLTVNGVDLVALSDSQRVAIFPYNKQLVIGKNRSFQFDGVVRAGLFTIFGHDFSFSYDTFSLKLQTIDSIKIAVETDEKDAYGNPLIRDVDNLIQLGTADLYIDDPDNKSGLKSLRQYPIINALTYSYIFYDRIPGLEGIYKQEDFYFKVDPFNYENIDHYSVESMNLSGEFYGGNILRPTKQFLIVQENNSLGFNMVVPEGGVSIYEDKGRILDAISMSNNGLTGSGTLEHLTSTTESEEYKFFPDSMLTKATKFNINRDSAGLFPLLSSQDVEIKWLTKTDEWNATNTSGNSFDLFDNGTTLDGTLKLTPSKLNGSGIINMTDSRITSNLFSFTSNTIKADTADYNLKSSSTSGYSFIAENANTDIDFDVKLSRFHLNTDSSVVKFPEIQYICTMTDFEYNMDERVLYMEQKGKSDADLLTAPQLLRLDFKDLDKPTFFATNNKRDTVAFSSWKGSYHLDEEYIEAENINYIHIADALIQPENGRIVIDRRGSIRQMQNAVIALNNRHILHSAKIDIETSRRYAGSAVYDYIDENNDFQQISFPELTVDTLTTSARGYIPVNQNFMLSPAFSFSGDVFLSARNDLLKFTGAAGIIQNCNTLKSYQVKFSSPINPKSVMIPISEKPRDVNDNLIFSGSYINTDSIHIYPAFLSEQKSWTDVALVNSSGFLYYEKASSRYLISSLEKIIDHTLPGNMVGFDKNFCILSGEGKVDLGANFDLVKFTSAGNVIHSIDSASVNIEAILALDFHFSDEALQVMADEIRLMPALKPVNLNSDLISKGLQDMLGSAVATQLKDEMNLFGSLRNLPKEFNYELLLNEVNLKWNEATSSFRSSGKIGIGFIGLQPINVYVDGYIEIQRRRSGDMIDVYLKADESTYYYFSYVRGVMMTQAGNNSYNTIIADTKLNDRKHPDTSVRTPYTYMIAVEDRLARFLQRMSNDSPDEENIVR